MQEPPLIETGIPCFRCGEGSGIDCPGREPDEATLCEPCFRRYMADNMETQARHQAGFIEGVFAAAGAAEAKEVWGALGEEEREGVRRILGEKAIKRILG